MFLRKSSCEGRTLLLLTCLILVTFQVDSRTVRPVSSRRVPFLSSINSRKAAKEAYAAHLQNELEATRRQLYTSQNTCTSLRKRCEDQRKETSRLMASAAAATSSADRDREENKQQLEQQRKEIERLQLKLQAGTQQFQEQVEKLTLLEAEMNEIKKINAQSNEAELKEYEEKLNESQQKQIEYEQEIELLTLKLEAAKMASLQQHEGGEDPSILLRAEELQARLQNVREKYMTVMNTAKEGGYDEDYQKEIEREMDKSIQLTLRKSLEAIEEEWETRYSEIEDKLTKMSDTMEILKTERDEARSQLDASISTSSGVDEQQLKEELTLELTESLTEELTEQLTEQLTAELKETLTKKIERKYKKKYKQIQNELEEQKAANEEQQSSNDLIEEQRKKIDDEISAAREQYELEFKEKLDELQKQSDERVQVEKDRMRKLVRALLEREAKQKSDADAANTPTKEVKKKKTKPKRSSVNDEGSDDAEVIQSSAVLTSRRKTSSRKGVARPSGF